jgi:hypothetical protein
VLLVEEQGAPEDLSLQRLGAGPEAIRGLEAVFRTLGPDLHLHQFVVAERLGQVPEHGIGDAILPDVHDGREVMAGGPEPLAQRTARHQRALLETRRNRQGITLPVLALAVDRGVRWWVGRTTRKT